METSRLLDAALPAALFVLLALALCLAVAGVVMLLRRLGRWLAWLAVLAVLAWAGLSLYLTTTTPLR